MKNLLTACVLAALMAAPAHAEGASILHQLFFGSETAEAPADDSDALCLEYEASARKEIEQSLRIAVKAPWSRTDIEASSLVYRLEQGWELPLGQLATFSCTIKRDDNTQVRLRIDGSLLIDTWVN